MRELELAFSVEPVVGWRVWRVSREIDRWRSAAELAGELRRRERERGEPVSVEPLFAPRLRSLTELGFWPARRRLEAACGRGEHHTAPRADCECGIWAFRAAERASAALLDYAHGPTPVALGRVHLWGRIVEHQLGWRAQYGYPAEVVVFGTTAAAAEALGEAYGVPAELAPWPAEHAA